MLEPPSIEQQRFRDTLARWASGVTILTASESDGSPVGMTAASFSSLSLDPPLVLVCIARSAYAHDALTGAERFAVHLLGRGQDELSARFAHAGAAKFDGQPDRRDEHNLPVLPAGVARLVCARHDLLDGGDHTILIGRVLDTELAGTDPLVYCNRSYHRLTT
ncbi:MAG TPA: flavin reductase family protein [Miltoncostaeaceae bacterium]|nr:flavin reductase family protein [Miltoncostaeaceae bacterium]